MTQDRSTPGEGSRQGAQRVLAYFRSDQAAQEALVMLTLIAVSLFGGDRRDDA